MANLTPLILVTVLLMIVATGIILMVLVYQKKQLQYINEKEQLKAMYEKEILESKLEIQERTMKNISQEIHDNIGQVLSVVKLNINLITGSENESLLQERVATTDMLVGKAIQDLRALSKSLDTDNITEKGLVKSIASEVEQLKKTGLFSIALQVDGEPCALPDQKELILFRICQEVLHNIIKHSQASEVSVHMAFTPAHLAIYISDNGQGFDISQFDGSNGLGISNMKNRSQMIGATYHINSQPGNGTHISIGLPLSQPASAA